MADDERRTRLLAREYVETQAHATGCAWYHGAPCDCGLNAARSLLSGEEPAPPDACVIQRDLLDAIAKVLEGFDKGIFLRDVGADTEPGWSLRLAPYITALAMLQRAGADHPHREPENLTDALRKSAHRAIYGPVRAAADEYMAASRGERPFNPWSEDGIPLAEAMLKVAADHPHEPSPRGTHCPTCEAPANPVEVSVMDYVRKTLRWRFDGERFLAERRGET